MYKNVKSDATPIPPEPKVEEPVTPPADKRASKQKYLSESSSDSDSEFSSVGSNNSTSRGKPASNVIKISKAKDVHIGSRITYFNTLSSSTHHHYTETDNGSYVSPGKNEKGPKPDEELLNSNREINPDDMYIVAENISGKWKKLGRFLPPENVFSDGQLKTFQDNNPRHQEEAVYEMLATWKQKYPERATVGILALTLWNIGCGDVAEKLKQKPTS